MATEPPGTVATTASGPSSGPHGVSATPQAAAPAPAPSRDLDTAPNPQVEAQRALEQGQGLLDQALQALGAGNARQASDLAGRACDRVGSALYFIRQATRR